MINFSTLQGLTIPVPQTVIPETSETSEIPLSDGDLFYGSYIVTVDGIEYPCETHTNSIGELFLGDSRLYMKDDMSNPVDIPFYAVSWFTSVFGTGDETAVCDVLYPDSETHTIEIKKMVDTSVTQIADASGRVLWSAEKVAIGTFYFRPSADGEETGVMWARSPNNSDPKYLTLCEEVSDEDSTYVRHSFSGGYLHTGTISFEMACEKTTGFRKVTSANLYVSYATRNTDTEHTFTITATLILNGNNEKTVSVVSGAETGGNYVLASSKLDDVQTIINNHISSSENGNLPSISIIIKSEAAGTAIVKNPPSLFISQIYVELECEYVD